MMTGKTIMSSKSKQFLTIIKAKQSKQLIKVKVNSVIRHPNDLKIP